jgi:hypothetical protein
MVVSEAEGFVAAGVDSPATTVGLNGLVPFAVLQPPPVALRRGAGVLRLAVDLPGGVSPQPGASLVLRLHGWTAGLIFAHDGRIQNIPNPQLPVALPYDLRRDTALPVAGELVVDISFWYTRGGVVGIQDVQWRQRITWEDEGQAAIELHYALEV